MDTLTQPTVGTGIGSHPIPERPQGALDGLGAFEAPPGWFLFSTAETVSSDRDTKNGLERSSHAWIADPSATVFPSTTAENPRHEHNRRGVRSVGPGRH